MPKKSMAIYNEQLALILRNHNIEIEVDESHVRAGRWGGYRLAEFCGAYVMRGAAGSFAAWAVIYPSGKLYILSLKSGAADPTPLLPSLFWSLLDSPHGPHSESFTGGPKRSGADFGEGSVDTDGGDRGEEA